MTSYTNAFDSGETCSNASTKTCRQLNEELCDDQDTISTTIGRRIDLSMRVKAILITLFAMEKSKRLIIYRPTYNSYLLFHPINVLITSNKLFQYKITFELDILKMK